MKILVDRKELEGLLAAISLALHATTFAERIQMVDPLTKSADFLRRVLQSSEEHAADEARFKEK